MNTQDKKKQIAAEDLRVAELRLENTPNRKNRIKFFRARAAAIAAGVRLVPEVA
jgi:hypothetical protein